MFQASQCVNVPTGASGSSTTSASARVPAGGSLHESEGETSSPSHVWRRGISPPCGNASLRLEHYAEYSGQIKKRGLTLHTVIDEIVPVAHESAYRETVAAAGKGDLLVQAYTSGIGHCNHSEAQTLAALHALDAWIASGVAPTADSFPAALGFRPGFTPPPWPQP